MSQVPDPLWGVDDAKEAGKLMDSAYASNSLWQRVRADLLMVFAVIVLTILLVEFTSYQAFPPWLRGVLVGGSIGLGGSWWRNRLVRRQLPSILKAEGRCMHCGYKLDAPGGAQCPECGTKCDAVA